METTATGQTAHTQTQQQTPPKQIMPETGYVVPLETVAMCVFFFALGFSLALWARKPPEPIHVRYERP